MRELPRIGQFLLDQLGLSHSALLHLNLAAPELLRHHCHMQWRAPLPIVLLWALWSCGRLASAPRHSALLPTIPEFDEGLALSWAPGQDVKTSSKAKLGPPNSAAGDPAASAPPFASDDDGEPRIGAIDHHVWIMPRPSHSGLALGKVRIGTSVRLRDETAVKANGCARGWHRVEPRGFVCLNRRTTRDLKDLYYRALNTLAPRPGTIWPYHYAHSRGAPMYSRVPTPEEWARAERRFGAPGTYRELGKWAKGHEELIEKERKIEAADPVPWMFRDGKRQVRGGPRDARRLVWKTIPNGSMLAYVRAFEMHNRVWLATPDLTIVPADRVQVMRRSTFRGVRLGGSVTLPLAWNRLLKSQPLYVRADNGDFEPSDQLVAAKQWVEITGERVGSRKNGYYELRNKPGLFIHGKHATFTRAPKKLPRAVRPKEKWLEARILPGTLTAYRGLKPVYATLFSPGKGGLPIPGLDHTVYATTAMGYFRFEWKERVATMSNEKGDPKVLWFSDVPHIQYVKAPLAMHVAYWHEDFGNRKSAECLNLSAFDGRWLFGFTDPPLPEGWGAVRPGGGNGLSTRILIRGL